MIRGVIYASAICACIAIVSYMTSIVHDDMTAGASIYTSPFALHIPNTNTCIGLAVDGLTVSPRVNDIRARWRLVRTRDERFGIQNVLTGYQLAPASSGNVMVDRGSPKLHVFVDSMGRVSIWNAHAAPPSISDRVRTGTNLQLSTQSAGAWVIYNNSTQAFEWAPWHNHHDVPEQAKFIPEVFV